MHSANKRVFFRDLTLEVCPEVYEPSEDSFLFAKSLQVSAGVRVLDVGTGSGILAILAAKHAREVVAMDINPYAIRCAKQNAKRNNVTENLAFLQGDLFEPLSKTQKFDLILFNSPYLPSELNEEQTWIGRAWAGGITGRQVIDEFIAEAPPHLELTGEILLLQSTLAGIDETIAKFQAAGLTSEVAAQQSLPFFETLILLKATFKHIELVEF